MNARRLIRFALRRCGLIADIHGAVKGKTALRVAVRLPNGLGNAVTAFAWLGEMCRQAPVKLSVDIYAPQSLGRWLGKQLPQARLVCVAPLFSHAGGYDLKLRIGPFVSPAFFSMADLSAASPQLAEWVQSWFLFAQKYGKYLKHAPYLDQAWKRTCITLGLNRQNTLFAGGGPLFGHGPVLYAPQKAAKVLQNFGLTPGGYITVHTMEPLPGGIPRTRQWPVEHWESFCRLSRETRLNIPVVQIGRAACPRIAGAEMDLRGKTGLNALAVVLKNSLLHVDEDSGLIPLSLALGTKNLVLLGPTPVSWTGLPESSLLVSPHCSNCAGLKEDWETRCVKGHERPECMRAVSPVDALDRAFRLMGAERSESGRSSIKQRKSKPERG